MLFFFVSRIKYCSRRVAQVCTSPNKWNYGDTSFRSSSRLVEACCGPLPTFLSCKKRTTNKKNKKNKKCGHDSSASSARSLLRHASACARPPSPLLRSASLLNPFPHNPFSCTLLRHSIQFLSYSRFSASSVGSISSTSLVDAMARSPFRVDTIPTYCTSFASHAPRISGSDVMPHPPISRPDIHPSRYQRVSSAPSRCALLRVRTGVLGPAVSRRYPRGQTGYGGRGGDAPSSYDAW